MGHGYQGSDAVSPWSFTTIALECYSTKRITNSLKSSNAVRWKVMRCSEAASRKRIEGSSTARLGGCILSRPMALHQISAPYYLRMQTIKIETAIGRDLSFPAWVAERQCTRVGGNLTPPDKNVVARPSSRVKGTFFDHQAGIQQDLP